MCLNTIIVYQLSLFYDRDPESNPIVALTRTIGGAAKHAIIRQHDVVAGVERVLAQFVPLCWQQRLRNHAVP